MELEELISEREGMIAENKQREIVENLAGYDEQSFQENAEAIKGLREKLIRMGKS